MTDLVKHLAAFVREYLPRDCSASPHTIASYALSFKRFVQFASETLGVRPCRLQISHLSVDLILDFLDHLEHQCGNSVRTRNSRLAALKSFFRYLEFREIAWLELARQVHAIPFKRFDQPLIETLSREQLKALLNAPDPNTFSGIRDRAMLHLTYAAGLRVSEIVGLTLGDLQNPAFDAVHVLGKGRRERVLPLWKQSRLLLRQWLAIRPDSPDPHLFLNARARAMTRQGFSHRMAVHLQTARRHQPSLRRKRVSVHTLRHACALHILEVTGDIRKVSLWLGHASIHSTEAYLRVDPSQKHGIMAAGFPASIRKGSFRKPPDHLMAILSDAARQ